MRRKCLDMIHELAREDERVVFIGSDLGFGTLKEFGEEIPDRFFMEGINEAHAVGMASGLAMEGKVVYLNTIATFLTRRSFEQICLDMCMHNANVRLVGNGGGLVYAPLGSTHLAFEDIAAMRCLPRMTIVAPADADEMARLMPQTVDWDGPMYIRLAKGYDPIVTNDDVPFVIGKGLPMIEGTDALIVTTGITLGPAQRAAGKLAAKGISAAVLHMPTIKPFDVECFLDMAAPVKAVVAAEEHTLIGGLGSCVAEIMAETDFRTPKRFKRVALPDVFPEKYGTQLGLMDLYSVTDDSIEETVESLLGEPKRVI